MRLGNYEHTVNPKIQPKFLILDLVQEMLIHQYNHTNHQGARTTSG
jgi:hypothetical protein